MFHRVYSQELKTNGTGYFVASSVTMADAGLLELLLAVADTLGESSFADYPSIQVGHRTFLQ